jgi:penicillin-binding protein 1C
MKTNDVLQKARGVLAGKWLQTFPENVDKASDFSLELDMHHPCELPFEAPHFVTDVLQRNPSALIRTSLDLSIQSSFETIVDGYISRHRRNGIDNASALLIDSNTMETLTVIGSADFFNKNISGQVNGTRARRSPGSALKPFAYALAMEQGVIHPQTMLKDTPTPFGTYTPDNFDRAFSGPLSATDALIHSRNIPAIYIAGKISDPDLYGFLKRAGIPLKGDPQYYGLSIVLGTAEVTMEETVMLYAALNNRGFFRRIKKLSAEPYEEGFTLLTPESCFLVLEMLSHNPRPAGETSDRWALQPQNIAWKTGTSVGFRDAWAIGVFDHYVLATWIGNFSGQGNPAFVGRQTAGRLLFKLIQALTKLREVNFHKIYPAHQLNITEVEVCALSGQMPHKDCPNLKKTWFIPGMSPISQCRVHRRLEIDIASGCQVCPGFEGPTTTRIFEFWPTDLLKLFKQAGIGRRVPPPLHPQCRREAHGDIGPKIISPKKDIVYQLRTKGSDSKMIPLIAVADGNVTKISWYIDSQLLGHSRSQDPLLWKAQPGQHLVRVIDEFGRSDLRSIDIKWVD